jgi:hypothetical protein
VFSSSVLCTMNLLHMYGHSCVCVCVCVVDGGYKLKQALYHDITDSRSASIASRIRGPSTNICNQSQALQVNVRYYNIVFVLIISARLTSQRSA